LARVQSHMSQFVHQGKPEIIQSVMPLKPDPRAGDVARCWLQI
jgi:hypothetical protein